MEPPSSYFSFSESPHIKLRVFSSFFNAHREVAVKLRLSIYEIKLECCFPKCQTIPLSKDPLLNLHTHRICCGFLSKPRIWTLYTPSTFPFPRIFVPQQNVSMVLSPLLLNCFGLFISVEYCVYLFFPPALRVTDFPGFWCYRVGASVQKEA